MMIGVAKAVDGVLTSMNDSIEDWNCHETAAMPTACFA
jgi:hypothetical protein